MSADASISSSASIECGACSGFNQADAQFCRSCGHSLYEGCPGCSKPVQITEAFCSGCGENLKLALETKFETIKRSIATAIDQAKQSKFTQALETLERISSRTDYRYKELAAQASEAAKLVKSVSEKMGVNAEQAIDMVRPQIEAGDHDAIVSTLADIPEILLPEDVRAALNRSKALIEQRDELVSASKVAIEEKDWLTLGPILETLITLEPDNPKYPKLAGQVGRKLLAKAVAYKNKGKYSKATAALDSIPDKYRGKDYDELRNSIETVVWLTAQFKNEPFDTPVLGRLAVRLAKEEPKNDRNAARVQQLSKNVKSGDRDPRSGLAYGSVPNKCWMDCKFEFLRFPQSLPKLGGDQLPLWAGRMNVALGLALQGLGLAKIDYNLMGSKGFIKKLFKKKHAVAWGMDIGSTAIKVVGLQLVEGNVELVGGFVHEFDEPLTRPGLSTSKEQLVSAAIEEILEKHDLENVPIWINQPAGDVINRFVLLPPVADKQAKELIEKEKKHRIPMDLDTLEVRTWTAPYDADSQLGRASTTIAVKKTAVEGLVDFLTEAGLNVAGVQADQIALLNLAYHELQEEFAEEESEDEEVDDDDDVVKEEVVKQDAVAIIHCGAEMTTAFVLSRRSHWFWSMENGGEELTKRLARQLKLTLSEAEQVKRKPHEIESPSVDYAPIELRLDEWRARLEKIVSEGLKLDPSLNVTQCFASGGGCYTHQWMKRILLKN